MNNDICIRHLFLDSFREILYTKSKFFTFLDDLSARSYQRLVFRKSNSSVFVKQGRKGILEGKK